MPEFLTARGDTSRIPRPATCSTLLRLREEVPTATLASLLTIADSINDDEEYRHTLSTGDMYQSLIAHMNRRAEGGDTHAAAVLEQRMRRILDED